MGCRSAVESDALTGICHRSRALTVAGTILRLLDSFDSFYAVLMTAQRKDTYFPELADDEQRLADDWLDGYLGLVLRIQREHAESRGLSGYPQSPLDADRGTGMVRTPSQALPPPK